LIDPPQVSPQGEPSHMSMVKRIVFVLLTVILVCAPIGLAELYLRYMGLGDPILYYANASYRYASVPNQRKVRQRGARVSIDSKGLRNTRDWSDPADAKILFIGDSVTWGGTYIDDAETFADGVCQRLARATGKSFVCGNAGANQYGTDNMAERIRYKDFNDETVLVVTLIAPDTRRGLADAEGSYFFSQRPPPPFRALWEAATFLTYRVYRYLRPISYRSTDDLRVAERSLQNLFDAIHATQRPGTTVLIVLSPLKDELGGHESALTKHVRAVLDRSGFEVLDLNAAVSAAVTKHFYYDSLHLDVQGHQFYADRIAARLAPALSQKLSIDFDHAPPRRQ
jgi:lysophospholipase L1-like esterase